MNLLMALDQDIEIVIRRKPRSTQGWSDIGFVVAIVAASVLPGCSRPAPEQSSQVARAGSAADKRRRRTDSHHARARIHRTVGPRRSYGVGRGAAPDQIH